MYGIIHKLSLDEQTSKLEAVLIETEERRTDDVWPGIKMQSATDGCIVQASK